MKIVISGASGFLGRHLLPLLQTKYGASSVRGLSSRDYDLMDRAQVCRMFKEQVPEILIHLAAYSGGIGANRTFPADFYYRNTILTTLVFQEAATSKISKLIYPMGGCSYPATAASPIDEAQMWQGFPQPESAGYSMAKKMCIVASQAYRQQYGLNSVVLIPGNMYGEYDNFRNNESHVIPAMARRFYEARLKNAPEITMWGTGRPVRDFVYAGDVARNILYFIEHYNASEPVNISSGTSTSIRELAETMRDMAGFKGKLVWDKSKPDGQKVKTFDVRRMRGLGLTCPTPLREGLKRTIAWLEKNYARRTDGIRL